MENKKSPNKIKRETQIYYHQTDSQLKWKDIKHLQFEDDDIIRAGWEEDDNFDHGGYWHGEITRMVEETDDQFAKRQAANELEDKWARERRLASYLRLKAEFENEDNSR